MDNRTIKPGRRIKIRTNSKRIALPRAETDLSGLGEPERVMLAWTALEVLSPQSFLRPEDLLAGTVPVSRHWMTPCHGRMAAKNPA